VRLQTALQLKVNTRVAMLVTLQALLLPTIATERRQKREKITEYYEKLKHLVDSHNFLLLLRQTHLSKLLLYL